MTTRDKLESLAANLWWTWNPEARDLFRRLNPDAFQAAHHAPLPALRQADPALLDDDRFVDDVSAVYDTFQAYMDTPTRADAPRTAYFCMEYGLHESMPSYSGGLGVLAGDHTKATSDLGLPFVAIGLFLKNGYFKQSFDENGQQFDTHPGIDPNDHPLRLVTDDDGTPVTVTVHLGDQPLVLKAWRLDVGRTPLYLLDADLDENPVDLRTLTHNLYQGGNHIRLQQEIVLGIGGVRLMRALDLDADVYHLNEGHCAFLTLELMRERMDAGEPRKAAERWVREHCVFTTHTPVPAGHDRFNPGRTLGQMTTFRDQLGLSDRDFMAYGRVDPDDDGESFTMTVLGLKMSRAANGVSRLNGEVARTQWKALYPDRPVDEVPIGHITNGIHLPTWTAPHARAFLEQRLGDWLARRQEPDFWKDAIANIPDSDLWQYRSTLRGLLLDFVADYVARQSLPQTVDLAPEALTIGFARRFATYKRAPLIFSDLERAERIFANADRPVQILFAGKAHPEDEGGKGYIRTIFEMSQRPAFKGKVVFLENYSMEIGRMLVSGCDVWLNNPRRPMEASGTSGQKIAAHGGLNVSILDGWWPEGYDGSNGWTIGDGTVYPDVGKQDAEDATALYAVLENEVIPAFYDRDPEGLPRGWISRMRRAMQTLPATFSAVRMVSDYVEEMYTAPATV
jgi:alpha-glucan phosphorylase-like protein